MIWNRMIGPYLVHVLDADLLQHHHAAVAVVQEACGPARSRLFMVAMVVNVGMWLERFVIVVTSLHRDFLPSSWGMYYPTMWDCMTFIGTIGLFMTLFFLFVRFAADDLDLRDADAGAWSEGLRERRDTDGQHACAAAGGLRPDGGVRHADGARRRGQARPTRPATAGSTRSRRIRSKRRGRRSASTTGGCR